MNDLAPIVLFCYNRPWHVEQTLNALSLNHGADQSVLYIFCDGPKAEATPKQIEKINEVRKVVRQKKWCKDVIIKEASSNKGLANSIIDGVSEVIDQHGKVIVLEDDLITSPYFLKYMNKALDYYEKIMGVFSISANRPPLSKMHIPNDYPYDVFACLRSYSTGWATWKDRWEKVDWTMSYLDEFLLHPEQVSAFNRCGDDMTEMLHMQREGKIDSWAIRFSFAHFQHHAVAISPCFSYVSNIGFDGSGIHSGIIRDIYENDLQLAVQNPRFINVVYEDKRIINAFYNVYCRRKRPLWQKAINFIMRKIGLQAPFVIKKKIYNQ